MVLLEHFTYLLDHLQTLAKDRSNLTGLTMVKGSYAVVVKEPTRELCKFCREFGVEVITEDCLNEK